MRQIHCCVRVLQTWVLFHCVKSYSKCFWYWRVMYINFSNGHSDKWGRTWWEWLLVAFYWLTTWYSKVWYPYPGSISYSCSPRGNIMYKITIKVILKAMSYVFLWIAFNKCVVKSKNSNCTKEKEQLISIPHSNLTAANDLYKQRSIFKKKKKK